MMNRVLAAALAVFCAASSAVATEWKAVPLDARDPTKPMPVAINLAQRELHIGADPGLGPGTNSYGLVGALMLGAIESAASKKARAEVEPLLGALGEFNASAPLMAGVRAGISDIPWLAITSGSTSTDNSEAAKDSMLNRVSGNYLVYADCLYRIAQSFESIFARCSVQIANKIVPASSSGARWKAGKLLVNRAVQSEVALFTNQAVPPYQDCYTSERRAACRSRWMENSAALLKKELTFALTQVGKLVGKEISLGAGELEKAKKPGSAEIVLSPSHIGYALEGAANVQSPGKRAGFWAGLKPAILAPNSDGVVVVEADGSLYHKRVVTVQ